MHNKSIVVCACGCHGLVRSDLVYAKLNNHNAWRCPNHTRVKKGECQLVIMVCVDCEKKEITPLRNTKNKIRCKVCQKIHSKKVTRRHNKKISIARKTERDELIKNNSEIVLKSRGRSIWY